MRKIIATEFYSLDGLMSAPDHGMDWVTNDFDDELGEYEGDLYDNADTLLLGRVTYKIFEGYWPAAASNPEMPEGDREMGHKINKITKIVFSKTLGTVEWENSKLLKEIDAEELIKIKQAQGKNILVVGSASLVRQLTNLKMIDEYHFAVHPVILGTGKPLFQGNTASHRLKLFDTKTFKNGVVLLKYQSPEGSYA